MTKKLSDVTLAYLKNVYQLDLARREFERQAVNIVEQVESALINIARKTSDGTTSGRWRDPCVEFPQREIAWLNFRANANITLDIKPKSFRNYKKDAAYLYFEIVFNEDLNSFGFQARFENQNAHSAFLDIDEKIIELARSGDNNQIFLNSNHVKTSTAILFSHPISDDLIVNLTSLITESIKVVESALTLLPTATNEEEAKPPMMAQELT